MCADDACLLIFDLSFKRKGRPDDLKSFDEMEKMTSDPDDNTAAPNQEEDQTARDGQGTAD